MSNELLRADILASWSRGSSFQEQGALLNRCYVALGERPAHDVASVPDGFVMVPAEPTHEMLEALWGRSFDQFDEGGAKKIARIKYQGLLAAAPKAEQPLVQEPVATVTIQHFRQDPSMGNLHFQLQAELPQGTHKLYASPVAQEPDIEQIMAKAKELFGWSAGLGGFDDAVRELVAFTAGHRFAQPAPAAQGWIPVSERLPEIATDVLVYGVNHGSASYAVAGLFSGSWESQETEETTRFEPTHWMPLPKCPEIIK